MQARIEELRLFNEKQTLAQTKVGELAAWFTYKYFVYISIGVISGSPHFPLNWLIDWWRKPLVCHVRYVTRKTYLFPQTRSIGFPKEAAQQYGRAAMRGSPALQYADRLRGNVRTFRGSIQCGRSHGMNAQAYALDWRGVLAAEAVSLQSCYCWGALSTGQPFWHSYKSMFHVLRSFDAAYEGSVLRVCVKALYSYVHTYLLVWFMHESAWNSCLYSFFHTESCKKSQRNCAENPSTSAWISTSACTKKSRYSSEKCKYVVLFMCFGRCTQQHQVLTTRVFVWLVAGWGDWKDSRMRSTDRTVSDSSKQVWRWDSKEQWGILAQEGQWRSTKSAVRAGFEEAYIVGGGILCLPSYSEDISVCMYVCCSFYCELVSLHLALYPTLYRFYHFQWLVTSREMC